MGIQGLLKAMKPYINPVHVKKYAGRRVGIDAYSWLHKGAYSCSMEICQNKFNDSDPKLPYLQYCMHRINMLRYYNVIPVVVFDGDRLPSKTLTEEDRQRKRTENLEQARARLTEGNVKAAIESFQRAVEITPFMAYQLIRILRSEGIEFIVAPYEADAQLAYLARLPPEKGGIEAVISEDSDLMAYGCNVIIYKMDRTGDGEEVEMDQVLEGNRKSPDMISFKNFTQEMFTGMCVLAGCDFLSSVHGIGVKRAHALVSKYRNLDRVISVLRMDKNLCVPEGYADSFREACAIFHHARVYDHNMKCLSFLSPLPEASTQIFEGNLDFLGPYRELPKSMVIAIAEGKLDPITMEAFKNQSFSQRERTNLPSGIRSENVREQPREVQTAKENSPFVFLSQIINEDLFVLPENKAETQLSSRHKEVARAVEDPHVCSVPAERITSAAERKRGSGSVSVSDSALNAHFRHILEESASRSTRAASQFQKENEDLKSSNVGTLDNRGQKRVSPIPPSNNPFKKQKRDTSASLTPNFNTGLEQKGASEMEPKTAIAECRTHEKTDEQPLSDMSINRSSLLLSTIKEMGCSANGSESPPDAKSSSASPDLSSAPASKSLQASPDLSSKLLHKVLSTATANEHHKKRKTGILKFFNKATIIS